MTLSPNINSREFDKFRDGQSGSVVAVAIEDFVTNDLDESGSTTYIGRSNGVNWEVQRIVETGPDLSVRYATIANNSSYTSYTTAWTNRLTLTYAAR